MTRRDWSDDDLLLRDLAEAVGAEDHPVLERRRTAAKAAFAWRDVDAELLALTHDSLLAETLVRGAREPRVLSFEGIDLVLEVEVDGDQVMGQVLPPDLGTTTVTVSVGTGPLATATVSDGGFFSVTGPVSGPIRFSVSRGGTVSTTEWVVL